MKDKKPEEIKEPQKEEKIETKEEKIKKRNSNEKYSRKL